MSKTILCKACKTPIKYHDDLVTATIFFEVYPFHHYCYVQDLKGPRTIILNNKPINGSANTFRVASLSFFAILWAIFASSDIKWVAIVVLPIIIYRLHSYFSFERHVKK